MSLPPVPSSTPTATSRSPTRDCAPRDPATNAVGDWEAGPGKNPPPSSLLKATATHSFGLMNGGAAGEISFGCRVQLNIPHSRLTSAERRCEVPSYLGSRHLPIPGMTPRLGYSAATTALIERLHPTPAVQLRSDNSSARRHSDAAPPRRSATGLLRCPLADATFARRSRNWRRCSPIHRTF